MTETSTITQTTAAAGIDPSAATIPFALMALGLHMAENHLPLWTSLTVPGAGSSTDTPRLLVLGPAEAEAWADTLTVTSAETVARGGDRYPWERITHATLPTGFRVDLVELLAHAPLQAVQS